MAKYAHADVLDGGPDYFMANVTKIVILSSYTLADNYTTVNVTNNVGEVASTSGDYSLSGGDGAARVMTTTAKNGVTATANAPGTPDLHVAYLSGSQVLLVTDELTNQAIVSGNDYNIPSTTYTLPQPV